MAEEQGLRPRTADMGVQQDQPHPRIEEEQSGDLDNLFMGLGPRIEHHSCNRSREPRSF